MFLKEQWVRLYAVFSQKKEISGNSKGTAWKNLKSKTKIREEKLTHLFLYFLFWYLILVCLNFLIFS